jgi:hypothetical protein
LIQDLGLCDFFFGVVSPTKSPKVFFLVLGFSNPFFHLCSTDTGPDVVLE